jgi:hypothetical protein
MNLTLLFIVLAFALGFWTGAALTQTDRNEMRFRRWWSTFNEQERLEIMNRVNAGESWADLAAEYQSRNRL